MDAQEELYGRITEVFDHGFVVYEPLCADNSMYVHLLYIKPEFRKKGKAKEVLRYLRDKHGVTYFSGYIDKTTGSYKESLLAHVHAGYDIVSASNSAIVVRLKAADLGDSNENR